MSIDHTYKPFAIVRNVQEYGVELHVLGDTDIATADELRAAIDDVALRDGSASLVINLSKSRYIDSSGLGAIVHGRQLFGTRFAVVIQARSQVLRLVRMVGLHTVMNVVTELPWSVAAFGSEAPVRP